MRVLLVGYSGHVASALRAMDLPQGVTLVAPGRAEIDLADPATFRSALRDHAPDVVINAGAYTDVERAEDEPEAAFRLNAEAPAALADAVRGAGAQFIHLSTDYVFDGRKGAPYVETDPARPLSLYGRSKLEGERGVLAAHPGAVVARVAWVFSPWNRSFVEVMLKLAETRSEVSVVDDQTGSPTSAAAIAEGLLAVARQLVRGRGDSMGGVVHMVSPDPIVRADFAEEVFAASRRAGGRSAAVRRVKSSEFPSKAERPLDARLDCTRLRTVFGVEMRSWRRDLDDVVAAMLSRHARTGTFVGRYEPPRAGGGA